MDRRELRLHVGPELLLALRHGNARVVCPRHRVRERDRVQGLAGERRPQARVEPQQLVEDRGPRAGGSGHDDGGLDLLFLDAGIRVEGSRQEQPRPERPQELLAGDQPADHVEAEAAEKLGEGSEAIAPLGITQVRVLAGAEGSGRQLEQLVCVERNHALGATHRLAHQVEAPHPVGALVTRGHLDQRAGRSSVHRIIPSRSDRTRPPRQSVSRSRPRAA